MSILIQIKPHLKFFIFVTDVTDCNRLTFSICYT
nr:MAG TPA: hypothetical protein [Caudoviricetes sp.]